MRSRLPVACRGDPFGVIVYGERYRAPVSRLGTVIDVSAGRPEFGDASSSERLCEGHFPNRRSFERAFGSRRIRCNHGVHLAFFEISGCTWHFFENAGCA